MWWNKVTFEAEQSIIVMLIYLGIEVPRIENYPN